MAFRRNIINLQKIKQKKKNKPEVSEYTCMKQLKTILILFWAFNSSSQAGKEVFTEANFIALVKQNHPVAKQAAIQVEMAKANLTSARGAFDPIVAVAADRKTFDGKNYYFHTNPELKIPTPIGVDIKAGAESNGGINLSSETTPGNSSYAGVEVALLKGLLIDNRRAALQQAKIFTQQTQQDQLAIINNLLFDAYNSYWQWAGAYQLYSIYSKFLQISNDRLRLVRISYQNGDRALIDTIEAYTQVQNFELLQNEAFMKLNTARLELSNFLWFSEDTAYIIAPNYVPDTIAFNMNMPLTALDETIQLAMQQNPALRSYNFKLEALEVEKRLKFQSLLPTLNVKANLLNKDYYVFKNFNNVLLENNYKWGVDFKIPLFLREGRGEYKKAKLKIAETNLELDNKRWETETKIRNYYNEAVQLKEQLNIVQGAYNNYNTLLKAEVLRFNNGESSLFLINTRENKVIEAAQKQVELRIKFFKSYYGINWAAGLLR